MERPEQSDFASGDLLRGGGGWPIADIGRSVLGTGLAFVGASIRIELDGVRLVWGELPGELAHADLLGLVIGDLHLGGFSWPIEVARATVDLSKLLRNWKDSHTHTVDLGDGMDFSLEMGGVRIGDRGRFEHSISLAGEFDMLVVCSRFFVCCCSALSSLDPLILAELNERMSSD